MRTHWRQNHVPVTGAGVLKTPPLLKLGSWAPLLTPGTQILLPSFYWCLAVSEIASCSYMINKMGVCHFVEV